jgi:hypothetical protein
MRAQNTPPYHFICAITERAETDLTQTRVALRKIDCRQVGFTARALDNGKNVLIRRAHIARISGRDRDVGLREPFDEGCTVSMCHEERALSQYVNASSPDTTWSFCIRCDSRFCMNFSARLVLQDITRAQAFLYNAPAFRQDDERRL